MNLAISNIAWPAAHDQLVAGRLCELGVASLEVAPTRLWADPLGADTGRVAKVIRFWRSYGISLVAMQSLLFNQPELQIFESAEARARTEAYILRVIDLAAQLGTKRLVFGSPKNRVRGALSKEDADRIALQFFGAIGAHAAGNDSWFCIEPNPTEYGCDYITTSTEGAELVERVNQQGFGLHLDAAGLLLAAEDPETAIARTAPTLRHFHVSEPFLAPVGALENRNYHERLALALKRGEYSGIVSIEMRTVDADNPKANLAAIETAVQFVQDVYL